MKVLVCGGRNYYNYRKVLEVLSVLPKDTIIIEGGAGGADYFAKRAAEKLGLKVREYRANWKVHGKAAGPIRNRVMLDEENPDVVFAFHSNPSKSKGTKDMIGIATMRGIVVKRFL